MNYVYRKKDTIFDLIEQDLTAQEEIKEEYEKGEPEIVDDY